MLLSTGMANAQVWYWFC